MKSKSNEVAAIIFAQEEEERFNRCSFSVIGRPVLLYPLLAASNAKNVDLTCLSTDSQRLQDITSSIEGIQTLHRTGQNSNILEEFSYAVKQLKKTRGKLPEISVILFGNSPCVLSSMIDNAVEIIQKNPEIDSVVSVSERHEFNANKALEMDGDGCLSPRKFKKNDRFSFFIDSRLIVVKTQNLLKAEPPYENFNQILGQHIHPVIQSDGMGDIDYTWQVPQVEKWLRNNGFSEKDIPYVRESEKPTVPSKTSVSKAGKYRVLVTTVPFGEIDRYPLDIMEREPNCEYVINPLNRKLKEHELAEMVKDFHIIVAGTEPITKNVMKNGPNLKLISRVGIGLDSVDLNAARKLGIQVSYTPDAPSPAVAELTIGHMVNLNRKIPLVDRQLREGVWQRKMGDRIANQVIGIIGTGRIGSRLLKHLSGFPPKKILVNDINPNRHLYDLYNAELVSKEELYRESDIVTLHVPLTKDTMNLVTKKELEMMKPTAYVINTSRGGMINEKDLYHALKNNVIAGAAIDTFDDEPYNGELVNLDNCYFTCHMGSCSSDCRFEMERFATEEAVRFIRGEKLELVVPEYEYEVQKLVGNA